LFGLVWVVFDLCLVGFVLLYLWVFWWCLDVYSGVFGGHYVVLVLYLWFWGFICGVLALCEVWLYICFGGFACVFGLILGDFECLWGGVGCLCALGVVLGVCGLISYCGWWFCNVACYCLLGGLLAAFGVVLIGWVWGLYLWLLGY